MSNSLTYINCKRLYLMKKGKGELTPEYVATQLNVVDIFLLAGRINQDEYLELVAILTGTDEETE